MSLKALLEFVIHVESFRNIDLCNQGVYRLKYTMYQDQKDRKIYACPYFLSESYRPNPGSITNPGKVGDNSNTMAYINDDQSAFYTKSFLIRFCEEEVEINEFCHYRAEIDTSPNYLSQQTFYLEVELIHSIINSGNNNDKNSNINSNSNANGTSSGNHTHNTNNNNNTTSNNKDNNVQFEFKTIATYKAKINLSNQNIHEYVPIIFDELNFCLASCTFHSTIIDFRFRINSSNILSLQKEDKIDNATSNVSKATKIVEPSNNGSKTLSEYVKKNFKGKLIFFDIFHEILCYTNDKLREFFVQPLKQEYEKLFTFYNEMVNRCIFENHKKKYGPLLQPPMKLIIPEFLKNAQEDFKQDDDSETFLNSLISEINFIGGQILYLWFKFIELIRITPKFICAFLQYEYQKKIRERWLECFVKSIIKTPDISISAQHQTGEKHKNMANKTRKNLNFEPLHVEDLNIFSKPEELPILFEQIFIKDTKENLIENVDLDNSFVEADAANYKGVHLIVFVHGFQGNSFDMKLIKNNLCMLHPEALLLCSSANEENTENDIGDMGMKLANEVSLYIKETCPANSLGRISFIGHSLGGLIIRTALPYLEEYADKMYTYMSLSTPHLGYMYNSSKIIEAGIWFLKQWKKSKSLIQLSMTDANNPEDSFLYKLTQSKGLGWFKNVALVSSYQDQYAPFESARMEIGKEALADSAKASFYRKMATNIMNGLTASMLHRIDVNFKITDKSLDTVIGRAAHIRFLECQPLIRMLLHKYDHFFC